MTFSPQAIETHYKGYRFRSRLEARWAVFLDVLGIPWEYEKQGYQLESGCYLPDFWLPSLECWFEIKPNAPIATQDLHTWEELALHTDRPFVLGCGVPGEDRLSVYCSDATDGSGGTMWWDGYCGDPPHWSFGQDLSPCLCSENDWSSREFLTPADWCVWEGMKLKRNCRHDDYSSHLLTKAITAARSARFEHGESPSIRKGF